MGSVRSPLPPLTEDERRDFRLVVDETPLRLLRRTTPYVRAEAFSDRQDPAVFARFAALYLLDDTPWLVHGVLAADESGAPVVRRFAIEAERPGGPEVTSTVLHRIRVALVRDRALELIRDQPRMLGIASRAGFPVQPEDETHAAAIAERAGAPKRGRPPLHPPSHYARIAQAAIALYLTRRRGIRAELAKQEGVDEATIRDWLRRARELGYLAKAQPGSADFRPGPNLTASPEAPRPRTRAARQTKEEA